MKLGNVLKTRAFIFVLLLISVASYSATPQEIDQANKKTQQKFAAWIPKGHEVLVLQEGDFKSKIGKGALMILEDKHGARKLLVFIEDANHQMQLTGQSNEVVLCNTCGGVMGDPFQDIAFGKNKFTVMHYGGSNWRWSINTTFAWSNIDKQWQLIEQEESSFIATNPENMRTCSFKPPKDFGKISLEQYNDQYEIVNKKSRKKCEDSVHLSVD